MTYAALKDYYAAQKTSAKELEATARKYVIDKSIPLYERWAFFLDNDLGVEDSFIVHFKCFKTKKWQDPKYPSISLYEDHIRPEHRCQVISTADTNEQLLEAGIPHDVNLAEYDEPKNIVEFTQEDYDAWREEVLELFLKSYTWDW